MPTATLLSCNGRRLQLCQAMPLLGAEQMTLHFTSHSDSIDKLVDFEDRWVRLEHFVDPLIITTTSQ